MSTKNGDRSLYHRLGQMGQNLAFEQYKKMEPAQLPSRDRKDWGQKRLNGEDRGTCLSCASCFERYNSKNRTKSGLVTRSVEEQKRELHFQAP
ncbi:hypothetical protein NC652_017913 [Populus alba x Populus x berolinensis]|nr:hypothetical protein NC652_017913 [Populus alba x Populus x berolinensis]